MTKRRAAKVLGSVLAVCAGVSLLFWGGLEIAAARLGPVDLKVSEQTSITVLDRKDQLLRAFTTADGRWRMPLEVEDVDPRYLSMLLAYEDRRFYDHDGVDPLAVVRAGALLARYGKLMSGGSTLTMQVARLIDGRHEKTGFGKLRQMVRAKRLERQLSKKDILKLYLKLAPFGGNIEGVRAASLAYFGKEPKHLSAGEAALLVALPQSPERRRPDRFADAARKARDHVLDRAVEEGVLGADEAERAKAERVPNQRLEFPKLAPHLSEREIVENAGRGIYRLTLDRDIQAPLEKLVTEQAKLQGPKLSAALMAVDAQTGDVIAHIGSADYLDESRWGPIDMTEAVRSPGSTLKPFIYGLAFEGGLAHPETLIEDRPTRFGTYTPENFDEEFHGTVTLREALGQSLNVPAVKLLSAVGPERLMGRFRRAGVQPKLPDEAQPSLAVALGGMGLTMRDLATLYVGLQRGGDPIPLTWRRGLPRKDATQASAEEVKRRRIMSKTAAWYVTDILKDAPPPPNTKRGKIAYKTGTSYGYRDAWAIGYDGRYVVAVWVGRPDGASTPGLMGRHAAAPILFDAFARISEKRVPFAPAPQGVLKVSGAELPPPLKRFRDAEDVAEAASPFRDPSVLIAFPQDRSELDVEEREDEPIIFKAEGGALPLTWLVDGEPVPSDAHQREVMWTPKGRGFVKLSVIDAKGRVDRVTVRLR